MAKNKYRRGVPRRSHGCQRPIDFFDARVRTKVGKYERNYKFDVACIKWSVRLTRVVPKPDAVDKSEHYNMTVRCRCEEPSWSVRARVSMYLKNYQAEDDQTKCAKDFGVFKFHPSENSVTYKNIMTVDDVMGEGNMEKHVKEDNFEPIVTVTVVRVRVGFYPRLSFAKGNLPGADFCALVGKKEFYMHKSYMEIQSPFFETALSGKYSESKNKCVDLKSRDATPRNFPNFLRSVYPLRQAIQQSDLPKFSGLSDFFMMAGMTDRCEKLLANPKCQFDIIKKFQLACQYELVAAEAKLLQQTRNKKEIERILQFCKDRGEQARISKCAIDVLTRRLKRIKDTELREYPRNARIEISLAKHADVPDDPSKEDLNRPYADAIEITQADIEKYKDLLKEKFGDDIVAKINIKPNVKSDLKAVKKAARMRRLELTKEAKLERRRRIRKKKNEKRKEKQAQQNNTKPRGFKEKRCRKRKNPRPASTEPPTSRPQAEPMQTGSTSQTTSSGQATEAAPPSGSPRLAMDVDN